MLECVVNISEGRDPAVIERLLKESARLLRRNDYLYTATVEPLRYEDGVVDVAVRTRDLWTLMPGASISRSGGENDWRVSVSEKNLLGRGMRLRLSHEEDVDRNATTFEFSDRNFGHSWVSVMLGLSDKSDGNTYLLDVTRPFYALDSRWSAGFTFRDDEREDRLYELGEEVAEYRHESDYFKLFGGWSDGLDNGWVRRWTAGVVYDDQVFSEAAVPELPAVIPDDRRLVYPYVALELLEDDFEVTSNREQIGRPEDFYMGRRLALSLGYAAEAFGSEVEWMATELEVLKTYLEARNLDFGGQQ